MIRSVVVALGLAASSAACADNDPSGPGNGGGNEPLSIPVLGTGLVPERHTAEVAVAGNLAYTSTWSQKIERGNAINVWDVSGNVPVRIDSIIVTGAGTTGDVQISDDGNLLVVATEFGSENGIAIYDRSTTPTRPPLIRRYATNATRGGVHTLKLARIGGRHYAFLALNSTGTERARLGVLDITDPANPDMVAIREMGNPFLHDVFVRDGLLFAALWHTGLTIFDVGGGNRGGSPANPVEMGTVKTLNCSVCGSGTSSAHNVWWFHDPQDGSRRYAFVGEEGPSNTGGFSRATGALHVVDVSNLNAPREVAVYEPDSTTTTTRQAAGAHNFVMDEASGILYAAFYNGGVRALDVRGDLSSCTDAQKTADGRCDLRKMGREVGRALTTEHPHFIWGVALAGNFLYASDMARGLHKLDISALKR